ncbi:MAG TPA: hypothetical protein VJZ27_19605, partial [Aggregatilineales bacterium]|nr:hypothetical protein [Aggregatilineales bacterium]
TGYDLARGSFLGIFHMEDLLKFLDKTIGLSGYTEWDTSISASMVLMMFFFFLVVWVFSPKQGLILALLRRRLQRESFATQLLLGHIHHHQGTPEADAELAVASLHRHLNWSSVRMQRILARTRALNLVRVENNHVHLTERGIKRVIEFREHHLQPE